MTIRRFTNELGNDIKITVEGAAGQVAIAIAGPLSESTSMLTRCEARELHAALGEVLGIAITAGSKSMADQIANAAARHILDTAPATVAVTAGKLGT